MVLQFRPLPPPPEQQESPNVGLQILGQLQGAAQTYMSYKQQRAQLDLQKQQRDIELAKAAGEGGQDFWNSYQALRSGKNPYGTGIPAAPGAGAPQAFTPSPTPTPQPPTLGGQMTPAQPDPYAQYHSVQDPFGPLPGMQGGSPAPQMSMAPQAGQPAPSPSPAPMGGGLPPPQSALDLTPEHLAQIRREKGSKGLKEYQDQQNFILDQKKGQSDLAQKGIQNSGSLRDDYTKASLPFQTMSENMQKIAQITKQPGTPASDMALMVSYMKVLDPGVMVREGQYARLEDTAGIPDKVRNAYNDLVAGRSLKTLTPTQRQQFVSAAANVYSGAVDRNKGMSDTYTGIAQRQGLNPQDVVVPYGMQNFNAADYMHPAAQEGTPPPAAPGGAGRQPAPSFGSVQAAESAGLPKGTIVMIGNRRAVIE